MKYMLLFNVQNEKHGETVETNYMYQTKRETIT